MVQTRGWRRFGGAIELVLCAVLVALVAVHALRRMDYLSSDGAQTIRMTDASRNALVAKNLVEGNGYTTNDLPAALVDFYDQRGKLHADHWVNADRFPFASYAIAAMYEVTRSTSWMVGILAYNLICFVGFLILLYACGRSLWNDRYAGLLAVTVALLHPYTFMYLYWKDGDMLLLTTACMAMLYRSFGQPAGGMSRRFAVALGTLLAWLFLSRPNLGAPFVLAFGLVALVRLVRAARRDGLGAAIRAHAGRELLVLITALAWTVPFVVHSMREWGQPLFSANNLYQLPLGTRFGMGTDTWWKYTEPGHTPAMSALLHDGTGELLGKFTSSWFATLKNLGGSYPVEILLAAGLGVWLGRRPADAGAHDAPPPRWSDRPARRVVAIVVFALVANLAVLPLYGYQAYSYRHYLGFGLPLLWLACGRALSLLGELAVAGARRITGHVAAHRAIYAAVAVAGVLAVNVGSTEPDASWALARVSRAVGVHWLGLALIAAIAVFRRALLRPPWFPRIALVAFALVYACYRPNPAMKRANLVWRTADDRVWASLQQRTGIVSSFALQGEVAWNTGRRNIPAPEWPMHIYSFARDHRLAIEDVYVESAAALISTIDGPFALAAPGFEGYARLQRWRTLPGYEVAFHSEVSRAYPQYRIKPHEKASTDFRLVDPAAIAAIQRSPDRIALGDPASVIYTAHGWGGYYTIDGKAVVAATDITRIHHRGVEGPHEDAGITFFLDARRPTSVDVEFYTPVPATYRWFWNLDLYAYDRAKDRAAHAVDSTTAAAPGWHKAHLEIPATVTRAGLNKLGFRASDLQPTVLCPPGVSDDGCVADHARRMVRDPTEPEPPHVVVVRPTGIAEIESENVAMFASSAEFHYRD